MNEDDNIKIEILYVECTCGLKVHGPHAIELARAHGWTMVDGHWWCGTCGVRRFQTGRRGPGGCGSYVLERRIDE